MWRAWLILAILGLQACVDRRTVELRVPPYLLVAPLEIDFGSVPVGEQKLEILELGNGGSWVLPVSKVELVDDSEGFSIRASPTYLKEGEKFLMKVDFQPTRIGRQSAAIVIEPDYLLAYPYLQIDGEVVVPLLGEGVAKAPDSALEITPNPLDFGTAALNCGSAPRALTVRNIGDASVHLSRAGLLGLTDAFSAERLDGTEDLAPGAQLRIQVSFLPSLEGAFADTYRVESEYQGQAFEDSVQILGAAAIDAWVVDQVGPESNPAKDILFIVDDSCSMQQEQDRLAENFAAFIQAADRSGIDYQIGVTTTDIGDGSPAEAGRLVPLAGPAEQRIVTRASLHSPEALFRANARVGIDRATQVEQGLEAIRLATTPPLSTGHNAGFLRPEADLAIVVVSDEDDQSARSVADLVEVFRNLKPGRLNAVRMSTIGGPPPVGCLGPNGSAIGGIRYDEATKELGGIYESICTMDWASSLSAISEATFGLPRLIFLTQPAIPETIEVELDGQLLAPDEWSYDPTVNSVDIGSRMATGAKVRYQAACRQGP